MKDVLLASDPKVFFTTPHFDGYPAVLVRLEEIPVDELEELIVEAWIVQAPKRLARDFIERRLPADARGVSLDRGVSGRRLPADAARGEPRPRR